MTRPIIWATGTLVVLALFGTLAGKRLAAGVRPPEQAHSVAAPLPAPATQFGDRIVAVDSDLRGHYTVRSFLDGRGVTMMVDTGASTVALTSEDAEAAGYRPLPRDYSRTVSTANGTVSVAPIRIRQMRVGDIVVENVEAVVVPPGRMGTSLMGMSFLRRIKGFDIARGRLTLRG